MTFKKTTLLMALAALTSAQLWSAAEPNKPEPYPQDQEIYQPKSLQALAAEAAARAGMSPAERSDISPAAREYLERAEYVKTNQNDPYRALDKAIEEKKPTSFLNFLLEQYKLDVNRQISGGQTFLIRAAQIGNFEAVQALLAHGANPNIITPFGQRALTEAATNGHRELAYFLLDLAPAEQQEAARAKMEQLLQKHEAQMRENEEMEEAYRRQQEEELRNTYAGDEFEESHPGYGDW